MTNITQGLSSYTASEITALAKLYQAGGTGDAATVVNAIVQNGNSAMNTAPQAVATIVTSGSSVQTGQSANTGAVSAQSSAAYSLALAYEATGNTQYLNQAKSIILDWAKVNVPSGDSIANAALMQMFRAYDMVQGKFSSSDQGTVSHWMSGIADSLISGQTAALNKGSVTAVNNHHSYQLLEVGTIGVVLGNSTYIHYLADQSGFLNQIGNNLQSVPGQPAYLGLDYQERHAYHYVAYNLQALGQAAILMDHLSHLSGNPYGINYNPFTVQVNGASIQNTLDALLPYASGDKQSLNEFQGSTDPNDAARLANGSLSSVFKPADALPALQAADYFGHTVNDPLTGHSYNLAQLTGSILKGEGKSPLTATLPDPSFLQNDIISPYDNTQGSGGGGSHGGGVTTVKVPTDSAVHSFDGSAGNIDYVFYKHTGDTTINNFNAGDIIDIEHKMYTSTAQVLSHITYSGNNAIIPLDGHNAITVTGVGHSLTAADFHIF